MPAAVLAIWVPFPNIHSTDPSMNHTKFCFNAIFTYTKSFPFVVGTHATNEKELLKNVHAGTPNIEEVEPKAAKELIEKLLVADPELRPKKVSDDALFVNVNAIIPFKPENIKCRLQKPPKAAEYFSNDPSFYGIPEAHAIRIPTAEFLN